MVTGCVGAYGLRVGGWKIRIEGSSGIDLLESALVGMLLGSACKGCLVWMGQDFRVTGVVYAGTGV